MVCRSQGSGQWQERISHKQDGKRPRATSCSLSEICCAALKNWLGWRRNHRLKGSTVQKKTGCENERKQTEISQKLIRSIHHRDCKDTDWCEDPPHSPPPPQWPNSFFSASQVSRVGCLPALVDICVLKVYFTNCLAASVCTNPAQSKDGAMLPSV